MAEDQRHPVARAVRAARAWSGKSKEQVAAEVGVAAATIGRWERGDWKTQPPRGPMLAAVLTATGAEDLGVVADLLDADPATRFAAQARVEGRRPRTRRATGEAAQNGEGAGGAAR